MNFYTDDRFCLDGQRLILVSGSYGAAGSEYRTEIDQFSRITANGAAGGNAANGPESFTVRTKDGRVMQLGASADSRIEAQGKAVVSVWALTSVTDVKGNAISYAYTEDNANGDWRLGSIGYGASTRSVSFYYEARPDVTVAFRAGSKVSSTARLSRIETKIGTTLVHKTSLSYAADSNLYGSRLSSVQTCDGANNCLAPLALGWTSLGTAGFAGSAGTGPAGNAYVKTGDFNGDGKTDMARKVSGATWEICYANNAGNGFDCSQQTAINLDAAPTVVGDFNGDGKSDMAGFAGVQPAWQMCLSTGSSFNCFMIALHRGTQETNYSGDFNGDGRTDFAARISGGTWDVCLSTGTGVQYTCTQRTIHGGSKSEIGDFNGDGLDDIASYTGVDRNWVVCYSAGDGNFNCTGASLPSGSAWLNMVDADFNGDGLTDMMAFVSGGQEVCLSTGAGFNCSLWNGHLAGGDKNTVGDFNGDGMTDIATYTGASGIWTVCLSTGTNFSCSSWSGGHGGGTANNTVGDFNGDGLTDMGGWTGSGSSWHIVYSQKVDRPQIQSIQHGSDATSITYQSMAAAGQTIYTRDATAAYPIKDVQFPIKLVSRVARSNGVGGTNGVAYRYGGMKVEQAHAAGFGRGNLGFRWQEVLDEATRIRTTTDFAQIWPYVGQVNQVNTQSVPVSGGVQALKLSGSIFGCYQTQGATPSAGCPANATGLVYHVFPIKTTEQSWDLNGAVMPTVETYREFSGSPLADGSTKQMGDITKLQVDVLYNGSLRLRKVTLNEYHPAKTTGVDWQIGRLKKATVTSSSYETTPTSSGLASYSPVATPLGPALTNEEIAALIPSYLMFLLNDD